MNDSRFKIGVFGTKRGRIVLDSARILGNEMVVTAVFEQDEKALEGAKPYFSKETKIYDNWESFITSGLDAVVLCNYFHEHAKYAIDAMNRGIAVLSETTAAPSLGECVQLVETAERTGAKYMLAANCPYFRAVHAMKKKIESGELGPLVYADAEYIHPTAREEVHIDLNNLHWRATDPACYYNMHSLGPLMYITNSMPVKVNAKAVLTPNPVYITNTLKTFSLTEMDNGAVFNTTGCAMLGTMSKWYRVACMDGTMETVRYDEHEEKLITVGNKPNKMELTTETWESCGALTEDEVKKYGAAIDGAGHGGIDLVMMIHFIKYLNGEEEPFFNIYRSVALSATGILSWYSILNNGKEYTIPDFSKKEDRDSVRDDFRKPYAKRYEDLTLPCEVGKKMKDISECNFE